MSSTSIRGTGLSRPTELFIDAPNYINMSTMGSTGVILTMPAGAQFLRLAANLDFYVMWGSSGATSTANSTGGASEFVPYTGGPIYRQITTQGTTMISVASTAAALLSQTWWSN